MSKINPTLAAALNTPAEKTEPAKPVKAKAVVKKTVATKPAAISPALKTTTKKTSAPKIDTKKVEKPVKEKTPKLKMERDSFTIPKTEYAQFATLKDRLAKLGQPVKKSELLRAGIMHLTAMTDAALKIALSKVPAIKTGRPKKK
ncbi:MAG: hypothetical protein Q8N02_06005 [Methylotenera sp.]|nr:hypothetical protein [Methylotenera sp.]MDO9233423.1 hypothetical protein [Methylotenera sp.]MDO9388294.1 hypothetical protein [Methylotenera sp.]MDP2101632.1 hypothetical protein [Methylotenera sp.]MDP2281480.1 hypothetical protein [Methylotenera sp.]